MSTDATLNTSTQPAQQAAKSRPQHSSELARYAELDGVRGMAALLVVFMHLFAWQVPNRPGFWSVAHEFAGLSWTGVHLFFILSGFLVGRILLANMDSPRYFSTFFKRRALRILPLYFLLISAVFALAFVAPWVMGLASDRHPTWSYFTLTQNIWMALHGNWGAPPLSITWSVALEEQFYLLLPVALWLPPRRFVTPLVLSMMGVGLLARLFSPVVAPNFLCIGAFDSLFLGTSLAVLEIKYPERFNSRRLRTLAFLGFALGAVGMGLIVMKCDLGAFNQSVIALFWGSFLYLVLSLRQTPWTRFFTTRPLVWVGSISYGVYLLHPLVHLLVGHILGVWLKVGSVLVTSLAAVAVTLLCAHLSFRFIESRLIALGRHSKY